MATSFLTTYQVNNLVNKAVELAHTHGFGQLETVQLEQEVAHGGRSSTTFGHDKNPLNLPPYILSDPPEWK